MYREVGIDKVAEMLYNCNQIIQSKLSVGSFDYYRHVGSENVYRILFTGKSKDKSTRKWYDSVTYMDEQGNQYTRCKKDFERRFKKI